MERKSIDFYNEKGYEYLRELLKDDEDLHGFIKRDLFVSLPMFTLDNTVKMFGYTNIYAYIPEYTEDYNKKKPLGIIEMELDGTLIKSEILFDEFRDNLPKSTKLREIDILQSNLKMLKYFPLNDRSEMVLRLKYSAISDKIFSNVNEESEKELTILLCIMCLSIPTELYDIYEYVGRDFFHWYFYEVKMDRSMYAMLLNIVEYMKKRISNYQF
jgi:hypothetical protein